MNAYSAFFSQQHEETMKDRTGLMGKRERGRETETGRKDESGAKTRKGERERGHSQIIGYNGEGCDE